MSVASYRELLVTNWRIILTRELLVTNWRIILTRELLVMKELLSTKYFTFSE